MNEDSSSPKTLPFLKVTLSESSFLGNMEFRPVQTVEELKLASQIVYEEYLKSGFIQPNDDHYKVSLFQTIPSTVTFIAKIKNGPVLATLTLTEDSPLGLPMDSMYRLELDDLRLDNRHMAELGLFAVNRNILETGTKKLKVSQRMLIIFHLFRTAIHYAKACTKVTDLVACFFPGHDFLYRFLEMEQLGGLRFHPKVNGNPAVARRLNIEKVVSTASNHVAYDFFFNNPTPRQAFEQRLYFSAEDLKELFVKHSNILASAEGKRFEFIQACYPDIDITILTKSKDLTTYLVDILENHTYRPGIPPNAANERVG